MIIKESIISAFTERGTLLKWLKKVEAALKSDVLTDISVDQVSETKIKLKFTFANGDYVESPVLTLPRGEQGEAATVEVGTVTTGEAGTSAIVTNVGTGQNAVLNFVIPRGNTGATGVGFDNASNIEQNSGILSLTNVVTGLKVAAKFKITAGGEVYEIPSTMHIPLKGSGSIVIDVDESGNYFNIHLDANIVSKINRALVTPAIAPSSTSIVAVNTSKSQTMLDIGYGLKLEGNTLKAAIAPNPTAEATQELSKLQVGNTVYSIPSGGGGGGGTQLYLHQIKISPEAIYFYVISAYASEFTDELQLAVTTNTCSITYWNDTGKTANSVIAMGNQNTSTSNFFKIETDGTLSEIIVEEFSDTVTPL